MTRSWRGSGFSVCTTIGVPIAGRVRSNVSLVEADGRSTKVNEPGPELSGTEVDALCTAALSVGAAADWVLWAGTLPVGFSPARLAGAWPMPARRGGVAVDASGDALKAVLDNDRDGLPHLIKPNADELAEIAGVTLSTLGDVTAAAGTLLARGVRTVLVSLGGDGAVLVDADLPEPLHGTASVRRVVNTVGAGDAFLAGFLAAPSGGARNSANCHAISAPPQLEHDGTLLGAPDPGAVDVGPCGRCATDLRLSGPSLNWADADRFACSFRMIRWPTRWRTAPTSVQLFLGDPQGWKKPKPRDDAEALKASTVPLYVHAPYMINVASANNRMRIPSRKILQQTCDAATEIGATAVIVHGGHADDDDMEAGFVRWVKASSTSTPRCPCTWRTPQAATTRWPATSTPSPGSGTTSATSASGSVWTPATPGPR